MKPLPEEFGSRLVTLHTGAPGLRGGMACEVKAVSDDEMDFIGSDGSVDRYNEVIETKGWVLENFRANPVIPDCHDYSSITKILGHATSVSVKEGRLVNRVKFCLDNPLGLMACKMAKGGFIKSQSVGFIPLEWTNGIGKDQPSRTYSKCELLEISLVVVPANPGATLALKGAVQQGLITGAELRDVIDLLEEFCGDREDAEAKARASGSAVHHAQLLKQTRNFGRAFSLLAKTA